MLVTTHPLLVQRSWKSRAILYPPSGPVKGSLYLFFTFYLMESRKCVGSSVAPDVYDKLLTFLAAVTRCNFLAKSVLLSAKF